MSKAWRKTAKDSFAFLALQAVKNKIHSWFVTHGKQRK